jgi:hypothetical protein
MPDWSALGRSSRNRGHTFERMIAKKLTELLSTKDNNLKFLRTPCSGGHGIKGDIYLDPECKSDWSNISIWCRTSVSISLEAMLCDQNSQPIRWAQETGVNSVWIMRNRPGRVFVLTPKMRLEHLPEAHGMMICGHWVAFSLFSLPHAKLNLAKFNNDDLYW